jgi:hypothetical protein
MVQMSKMGKSKKRRMSNRKRKTYKNMRGGGLKFMPRDEDYHRENLNVVYYMKLGKFVDEGNNGKLYFDETDYVPNRNSDLIYMENMQL